MDCRQRWRVRCYGVPPLPATAHRALEVEEPWRTAPMVVAQRRLWWLVPSRRAILQVLVAGALTLVGLGLALPLGSGAQQPAVVPGAPLACLGETRSLILSSGMPYTPVRLQGRTGFFVVDLGADGSAISPTTFLPGPASAPRPMAGSVDHFEGLEFFGPWGPVRLSVQAHSGIQGPIPQAGLIGTDLLQGHVVTLDYARGLLHRAERESFCSEAALRQAGFAPLSTSDYYGTAGAPLRCPAAPRRSGCPNIPTVPVRIGPSLAVAQIDTGYDDGRHAPSVNVNRAWLAALVAAGVKPQRMPEADLSLSTCAGVAEPVWAYRLPEGLALELVGSDGRAVRRLEGVTLFLKDTPAAAGRCGGIGTWRQPAAQLGASVVNGGTLVVDPFAQRVWFRFGEPR
ncbi:MAG: hypothetical protein ACKO45_14935 [Cyanobium sp.]